MVAGAFAVTFVGFGSAYSFSTFVASLQKDFVASRGSVSLVFSLAGFLYFALGIVSGIVWAHEVWRGVWSSDPMLLFTAFVAIYTG